MCAYYGEDFWTQQEYDPQDYVSGKLCLPVLRTLIPVVKPFDTCQSP